RGDEFLEKRSKNVKNRKKLKHDHRLGRKGYARMVDDLGRISGDNVYGRATVWKLARQDKKRNYKDNTTKDVADRMGRSKRKILDDGNRFNVLQKIIEELEKELEDSNEVNRGQVQLLIDTVKEKERRVEELERQLRTELDDGNQVNANQRRIKEFESQLAILNEVNLADVQKLTAVVKEKERSEETLERELM
ncbi:hypothetical protein Dimus_013726, partial [Dionaea muscipula]